MKKLWILIVLAILIPTLVWAWGVLGIGGGVTAGGGGLSGDYFTCDWSGADWTTEGCCGGSNEFDSTATSNGSVSVSGGYGQCTSGGSGISQSWASGSRTWTNTTNAYTYGKIKFKVTEVDGQATNDRITLIKLISGEFTKDEILIDTFTNKGKVYFTADGCGGYNGRTSGHFSTITIAENTDYWLAWAIYNHGSAGTYKIWISTDETITVDDLQASLNQSNINTCPSYIDRVNVGIGYQDMYGVETTVYVDDLQIDDDTDYEE